MEKKKKLKEILYQHLPTARSVRIVVGEKPTQAELEMAVLAKLTQADRDAFKFTDWFVKKKRIIEDKGSPRPRGRA
jgi:hypothetical protein